jgi:hypothetical protein
MLNGRSHINRKKDSYLDLFLIQFRHLYRLQGLLCQSVPGLVHELWGRSKVFNRIEIFR